MHTFVDEHPEFGFSDVRVGYDAVLGGIGQGYELARDWFVEERLMIGARAIGAAERALRTATAWAGERVQGGGPIVGHQRIQGMIAHSVVDIATNRALVHRVAWEADHGLARKLLHGRRRWSSSARRRRRGASSIAGSRSSAAAATCARTRASGST